MGEAVGGGTNSAIVGVVGVGGLSGVVITLGAGAGAGATVVVIVVVVVTEDTGWTVGDDLRLEAFSATDVGEVTRWRLCLSSFFV
jgi:hypothetical protein